MTEPSRPPLTALVDQMRDERNTAFDQRDEAFKEIAAVAARLEYVILNRNQLMEERDALRAALETAEQEKIAADTDAAEAIAKWEAWAKRAETAEATLVQREQDLVTMRALVEQWRIDGRAEWERLKESPLASGGNAMNAVYQQCADDLDALLRHGHAGAGAVDG